MLTAMRNLGKHATLSSFKSNRVRMASPYVALVGDTEKVYVGSNFVDLKLSDHKKWMDCNIGATEPWEFGKYFQWGDTVGYTDDDAKAHSTWQTTPFNDGDSGYNITYFNEHAADWGGAVTINQGTDDEESTYNLKLAYGPIYKLTSGDARIPTKEEVDNLLDGTIPSQETITYTDGSGVEHSVDGWRLTSKEKPSASIFIPLSGYVFNGAISLPGGGLWTSTLNGSRHSEAYSFNFNKTPGEVYVGENSRVNGYCLRGVSVR